jgi:hypothetical protein
MDNDRIIERLDLLNSTIRLAYAKQIREERDRVRSDATSAAILEAVAEEAIKSGDLQERVVSATDSGPGRNGCAAADRFRADRRLPKHWTDLGGMVAAEQTDTATARLLRALLALAVDDRERRVASEPQARKTEVLLDGAGLDSAEIAMLVGKQPGSVRMTLSRARRTPSPKEDTNG